MSFTSLLPLLKKTGSSLSVEAFQARINVIFHDHEANFYDEMHTDMWESLQEQIDLLVDDWFAFRTPLSKLNVLDIGSGTGLSTQKLIQSKLGPFIEKVTLLDTSQKMLEHAKQKAATWKKEVSVINSDINEVNDSFDVILVCSVLHHIPELRPFLNKIETLLKPGGVFIHLQDPNGDYLGNALYQERQAEYKNAINVKTSKKLSELIPKPWKHFINRNLGRKNYIDAINDQLLREKVIKKRMTADEIWSVTDIHVESKFNTINKGISFQFLKKQLSNFQLIKQRSYAFYGVLKSDLPETFKESESQFISDCELNGRNISCIWIKNN